jgi:hypothetical protein
MTSIRLGQDPDEIVGGQKWMLVGSNRFLASVSLNFAPSFPEHGILLALGKFGILRIISFVIWHINEYKCVLLTAEFWPLVTARKIHF